MPKILANCGHTVCLQCLRERIEESSFFLCPEDQTPVDLAGASADTWPNNKALLPFLNRRTSKSIEDQPASSLNPPLSPDIKEGLKHLSVSMETSNASFQDDLNTTKNQPTSGQKAKPTTFLPKKAMPKLEQPTEPGSPGLCRTHGKPLELVCENPECQTLICYDCPLFGSHQVRLIET